MRVLLINPSQGNVYGVPIPQAYPPLGLLYIGAVLEENKHEVRLIDMDNESTEKDEFKKMFMDFNPDLVGITGTTSTINNALKVAKNIKGMSKVPIVLGGIHATIAPKKTLESEYVDIVAVGEAEDTIRELVENLDDLEKVKGIWFKKEDKIIANEPRGLIHDLDTIPFPARHLLKNPEAYAPPDALHKPVASIMTTRGCFGQCTYCCTKQIFGLKIRARSVENILEEIDRCIKEYGVKEIHFMDDNFVFNKKRVLEFCEELKKRKYDIYFEFANGLRADNVDRDILQALKDIGVVNLGFGVESGNQQILDNIKKGIKKERVVKAFKLAKEFGFQTWGFFMFGLPGETKKTMQDTIDFAIELDPDFAKFLILKPYPGSEVFNQLNEKNLIFNYNYSNYGVYTGPVHRLPDVSADTIQKYQQKANRAFYLRPGKVLQHIKRIKTWDQFKSNFTAATFLFRKLFK